MNHATTDDCKIFIQDHAAELGVPAGGSWKRVSKTKGETGWARAFVHATGAEVTLIEPFGLGADGLYASTQPASPTPTKASAQEAPIFERASPAMQAAMLWRDAMRVLGGAEALHTSGPKAHGWSWSEFKEAHNDFSGNDNRDNVQELTQEWVDLGMEEPAASAMLLDGISWCFDSDAEFSEAEGYWDAGDGANVAVWPTDAPDEFGGDLGNPVYSTELENSMEGVFVAGASAATGREAFIRAWDEMSALGLHFDMDTQLDFNQNCEYDEDHPIDEKIRKIIPALIAAEEAKSIDAATGHAATRPANRPAL